MKMESFLDMFYWGLKIANHAIHVGKNETCEWKCQN